MFYQAIEAIEAVKQPFRLLLAPAYVAVVMIAVLVMGARIVAGSVWSLVR